MNKKKLPYVVIAQRKKINEFVFYLVGIVLGFAALIIFPDSLDAVREIIVKKGLVVTSIATICYALSIPFVNKKILFYVDKEVIKFRDSKDNLLTCSWENMKSMSFMHLPIEVKCLRKLTPCIIKIETIKGNELLFDYRFIILNLYKFRRILREASGRDDILQSKGPLWTKIF